MSIDRYYTASSATLTASTADRIFNEGTQLAAMVRANPAGTCGIVTPFGYIVLFKGSVSDRL